MSNRHNGVDASTVILEPAYLNELQLPSQGEAGDDVKEEAGTYAVLEESETVQNVEIPPPTIDEPSLAEAPSPFMPDAQFLQMFRDYYYALSTLV